MTTTATMAALAVFAAALSFHPVEGNGVPRRELRPVGEVRELAVSDGLTVQVTVAPGEPQRLVVAGDENVVPRVATEVRRGRLRVFALSPLDPELPLRVELRVPALERVEAARASSVEVDGAEGDSLHAVATDASRLTLGGHARAAHVVAKDASMVLASDLDVEELTADVRHASTAELRATRVADVAVQYSSAVRLTGTPGRVLRRTDAGSRLAVE